MTAYLFTGWYNMDLCTENEIESEEKKLHFSEKHSVLIENTM